MSRAISAEFLSTVQEEGFTLCVCVKLSRTDGTVMGFTTWDSLLTFDGIDYEALSAVTASTVKATAGVETDNLEIIGLIQSDVITESDVIAGKYDGATVEMFWLNPEDTSQGRIRTLTGYVGEIRLQDGQYTVELLSLAHKLRQHPKKRTSELCRVKRLGDTECGKDLTAFTHTGTVSAVTSRLEFTVGSMPQASGYFDYGTASFSSGNNDGFEREVKTHTLSTGAAVLILAEPLPYLPDMGDDVTLIAGCDRRIETCSSKFNNALHFRGEPYLPLEDAARKRGLPQQ